MTYITNMDKYHEISTNSQAYMGAVGQLPKRLKLLSYNIQAGIPMQRYRHYITRGWQHFLPDIAKVENLNQIAKLLSQFDVVALQEADGGSVRSYYLNQVQYLAARAGFPYWHQQINRNFGKLAQHGNGVLSKYEPLRAHNHKLPSRIPGRGAILMEFGSDKDPLALIVMHLSLSKRARQQQLAYIAELVKHYNHVILMGDLNTPLQYLMNESPLRKTNLLSASHYHTFPSWKPRRDLDHIIVSPTLIVHNALVLPHLYSDHLPLAIDVSLPDHIL